MANKRYDQFAAGTYDTGKIFLQADAVTGALEKVFLPPRGIWGEITGTLSAQSDLNTALAGKEPTITAGTNLQYWRGDKVFATLNTAAVPELTNLYYTDARARAAISLTTTGTSGASTYNNTTGVLNIPNYTSGAAGWGLTGNAGTTAGTNFIGTTDNVALQIKTNGTARVFINTAAQIGINATPLTDFYFFGGNATNVMRIAGGPNNSVTRLEFTENESGGAGAFGGYMQYDGSANLSTIGGINSGTRTPILTWDVGATAMTVTVRLDNSAFFKCTATGAHNSFISFGSGTTTSSGIGSGSSNQADLALFTWSGQPMMFSTGTDGTNTTTTSSTMWLSGNKNMILGSATDSPAGKLQVNSTTQGVLFPRMTTTQKNAIASPLNGLVIYDTTLAKLCLYTTAWEIITSV